MNRARMRLWAGVCLGALLIVGAAALLWNRPGEAQVQLVTAPGRDAVELTIYESEDLTYAKERRNITLRKGTNLIQFSWAGTQIDPTSVQLTSISDPEKTRVKEAIFPKHLNNAIQWSVESTDGGANVVEVSYFIRGLRWHADYMMFVNSEETLLRLSGRFTLINRSGEDFEDVSARLVVGDIHLVSEKQLQESLRHLGSISSKSAAISGGRVVGRGRSSRQQAEALSEYYMFAVPGKNTLEKGWTKKIEAMDVQDIPLEVVYRYSPNERLVRRMYAFVNNAESRLGKEPLPAGAARVFMVDSKGQVEFVGSNRLEFSPVSKEIKLDLGHELAVTVERKRMDFKKMNLAYNDDGDVSHFDTEEEIRIEARNFRPESVKLELPERIGGQWEMLESSQEYEREDASSILYTIEIKPGETQVVNYRFRRIGR
ncbi:MAG: hypothetical protein OXT69_07990 [Candidatus Poribacteria bacterium]|nr:hypothetical protein [Candidatus Poribacteria bacterium]